jgi:hypothetical protein
MDTSSARLSWFVAMAGGIWLGYNGMIEIVFAFSPLCISYMTEDVCQHHLVMWFFGGNITGALASHMILDTMGRRTVGIYTTFAYLILLLSSYITHSEHAYILFAIRLLSGILFGIFQTMLATYTAGRRKRIYNILNKFSQL